MRKTETEMQIECYYAVIVNKNGVWLDLVHAENNISTRFYETWKELLDSYAWELVMRSEETVHVRAAF